MSTSRKKRRSAEVSATSPSGNTHDSSDKNLTATFQCADDISFTHPCHSSPSALYQTTLNQCGEFRRLVEEELVYIAGEVARTKKSTKGKVNNNPYETQRKKLLSAQVELARMDFVENAAIADLLYRSSHFGAGEEEEKAALDASTPMREVQHIISLFDALRANLTLRAAKNSKLAVLPSLILALTYTLFAIPMITLVLVLSPLDPLWVTLFGTKNHFFPIDMVQKLYARGFMWIVGVRVNWYGMENANYDESTMGMFSHGSNLDPFIIASGPMAFKWIGKKSLFKFPVIGWILKGLKHIPIDRANREKAIESLKVASEIIKKHKRCIAVSPEGTRSRTGRLLEFKKGAFHTAMQVNVPMLPLLIDGAYELWPSGSIFVRPGTVTVNILPAVKINKNDTYNTLASRLRRTFLNNICKTCLTAIKEPLGAPKTKKEVQLNYGLHAMWLPAAYFALYIIYALVKAVLL